MIELASHLLKKPLNLKPHLVQLFILVNSVRATILVETEKQPLDVFYQQVRMLVIFQINQMNCALQLRVKLLTPANGDKK